MKEEREKEYSEYKERTYTVQREKERERVQKKEREKIEGEKNSHRHTFGTQTDTSIIQTEEKKGE